MREDLERLKQHIPLLEYLNRHEWKSQQVGTGPEFVGLCPLHEKTHASFYVNAQKNLFYRAWNRTPEAEELVQRQESSRP